MSRISRPMSWPLRNSAEPTTRMSTPSAPDELGGLAVDPAVDVDLAAERLVAQQVRAPRGACRGATSFMNVWPPKPGSTVMTRTMSSSSRYGSSAASGVPGLTARPAARPASRIRAQGRRDLRSSISTWNVIESQPASRYSSM